MLYLSFLMQIETMCINSKIKLTIMLTVIECITFNQNSLFDP